MKIALNFSITLLLLFFSLCTLNAQVVKIKGQLISEQPVRTIYLNYTIGENSISDSTKLKEGKFYFEIKLPEVTSASLIVVFEPANGEKKLRRELKGFYMEPGEIEIDIKDSLKFAKVTGSKSQLASEVLAKLTETYTLQQFKVMSQTTKFLLEGNREEAKKIGVSYMAIEQEKKEKVILPYLLQNPNSPIALSILRQYAGFDFEAQKIEPIFMSLPLTVQNSPSGLVLRKFIEIAKKTGIGAYAMPFIQNDTLGKPVSLASFKGKFVLLDFWASWCAPCRGENPNVVKAFKQFKNRNFTVLGISLDRPGKFQSWMNAIHEDGLTWTHLSDLKFWNNEVALLYGITAIPQNFLIDPTGKIIAKNIKGEELLKKLSEVLPEK